ncbi:MAG: hypothetical protein HY675_14825 [Chloroflexi bacterium]|nr:hypothetical protein [Chloroflexota bacterium]
MKARQARPLHVHCTYPPNVAVISVYQPSAEEWIDFRIRRYLAYEKMPHLRG